MKQDISRAVRILGAAFGLGAAAIVAPVHAAGGYFVLG
jgi:hypothetical protein